MAEGSNPILEPISPMVLSGQETRSSYRTRRPWPWLFRKTYSEAKFVIADQADWDFATRIIEEYELESRAKTILISPAWEQVDLQELAGWITESGLNVRMQLQIHKYIWGPDVHGV